MIKLKHDSAHWPVALIVAQGELSLQQHLHSLTLWDSWFSRQEPFHVIRIFLDQASLRQAKGVGQATQAWLKQSAAAHIRELVMSMLIVVPKDQYADLQKMSVRKAFDVPGGVFSSLDKAFAWLEAPPEPVSGGPLKQSTLLAIGERVEQVAGSMCTPAF